jgi:hypothetical protein
MRPALLATIAGLAMALIPTSAQAWGGTAHAVIDRAAIESIPDDGPVFLRRQVDYIAGSASLPDAWRNASENFSATARSLCTTRSTAMAGVGPIRRATPPTSRSTAGSRAVSSTG